METAIEARGITKEYGAGNTAVPEPRGQLCGRDQEPHRERGEEAVQPESLLITGAGAAAGIGCGAVIGYVWVLAAVLPARRAARLDPVRALGYE